MSEIINKTKLSRKTVIQYLHKLNDLGYCKYDANTQRTISGKRNIRLAYEKNKKAVICLDTQKVFESCTEAYKWLGYNIDGHSIQDNCKGITQSAGKHPVTKQKLHWRFLDDCKCDKEGD